MGNKTSAQHEIENFQNNYVKLGEEDNKNYGKVNFYHNKNNRSDVVMLKNQWSNSLTEEEDMDRIIANRQNIVHPNLAQTRTYAKQDDKQWCSTFHKHTTGFEYHENNLETEIAKRVSGTNTGPTSGPLTEPEFWYLTNSTVSADLALNRDGNAYHGNIQPSTIMLDDAGKVKLIDNQLIHFNKSTYTRMLNDRNIHAPLSPNLLEQLKIKTVNPVVKASKEESWAVGISSLCAATNTKVDDYYDWSIPALRWDVVHDNLNKVDGRYSKQAHGFIESCLEESEDRRPALEDHERFFKPYQDEINQVRLDFKSRNVRTNEMIIKPATQTIEYRTEKALNKIIEGDDDFFQTKQVIVKQAPAFRPPSPKFVEHNADDFFNRVERIVEKY